MVAKKYDRLILDRNRPSAVRGFPEGGRILVWSAQDFVTVRVKVGGENYDLKKGDELVVAAGANARFDMLITGPAPPQNPAVATIRIYENTDSA